MAKTQAETIRETDLYKPVHDYLVAQGYEVQGEVNGCDLAAIMGDDLIVIELKTSFNLKLLYQAVKRQRVTESVYVAVPRPKGGTRTAAWREMCMLLRRLEIGLITVALNKKADQVEVHFHPNTFDRMKSMRANKRIRYSIIKETAGRSGHYNTGGANKTKLITAYREQAIHIVCCMMKYGKMSPAQLKKMGTSAKTPNILRDNHYGWFIKVTRGIYDLDDSAREFLKGYPELQQHYMGKISEWEQAQAAAEAEAQAASDDQAENKKAGRKKGKADKLA
ncbi:MAG: hypothetical protein GX279_11105 [Clostridiaceae bacterium]|nr:hypothetical protein [Clostridiaceae bacterium]